MGAKWRREWWVVLFTWALVVAWALPIVPALGITIFWDGTGTGWNVASAWSTASNATTPNPAAPPGASDVAQFNISTVNTAQTVNLNVAQSALGVVFSSTGTVLIQTGSGTNTLTLGTSGITVNSGAGADTISSTVLLNGAQTWTNNSANTLAFSGLVTIGSNSMALDGTGAFSFININGLGTVTKNGAGTMTYAPTTTQQLDLTIGAGTVNTVADASADTFDANSTIAVNGTSALNLNENTTLNGAQLSRANGATVTVAAGKTLTIQNGGDAIFTGSFATGSSMTTGGNITVSGAGSTLSTTSTLNILGGSTVNVTAGGALSSGATGTVFIGGVGNATVTVDGSGSSFGGNDLRVGQNGFTGSLTFSNHSSGAFTSLNVCEPNVAGTSGTLNVQSGASVTGTQLILADGTAAGTGTLTITGAGSALTLTTLATNLIGASSLTTATLNVQSGGAFNGNTGTTTLNATGTININGGTVNLAGPLVRNGGTVNFNSGALAIVDNWNVGGGGLLGADVTFDTTQRFTTTGNTTIDAFHSLTVSGGTFNTGTLVANGTFNFTSGTVGITGAGGLTIGSGGPVGNAFTLGLGHTLNVTNATTINPGSLMLLESGASYSTGALANSGEFDVDGLAATANAATVSNSGLIRGEGRIIASAASNAFTNNASGELRAESGKRIQIVGANGANAGKINLQGGTAEFTQPLANGSAGQIVGRGTLITSGTGLTNNGNIALSGGRTDVFGDVNNATGSGTKGITISGNAGVTFWDDVINGAGSLFKVSSGSSATFFGTFGGAGISGTGSTYFESDITPGFSPASITFGGDVAMSSTAKLNIELGGMTLGTQFDHVNVSGQLALDGTLNISLINNFTPTAGNSFDILDWGTLSGTFATLQLHALSGGLTWNTSQLYSAGILSVTLPGDYNGNGVVNAADYVVWRKNPSAYGGDPAGYNTWRANFGRTAAGAGSDTARNAAVPEPANSVILTLVAMGWCLSQRRAVRKVLTTRQ